MEFTRIYLDSINVPFAGSVDCIIVSSVGFVDAQDRLSCDYQHAKSRAHATNSFLPAALD
jgi:hypothetical protein